MIKDLLLFRNRKNFSGYPFSDAVKMLWNFFSLDFEDLKGLIPISVSYGLLTLVVPLGSQLLVNRILSTALPSQAFTIVVLVSLGLVAAALLRIAQRIIVEKLQRRFHSRIVLSAAIGVFQKSNLHINHLYYDTFIVQKSVSTLLMDGLGVALQVLFALILLAFYHPFFLAFDVVIVLGLFFVVGVPISHLLSTAVKESKAKHETADFLSKANSEASETFYLERADEVAVDYLKARQYHFSAVLAQMIGLSGLHIIGNALLLGFGSYFVIQDQMSLGQLVAAELVFSAAFLSVEKLNKHLENFYDLIAALDKLSPIALSDSGESHESH